MKSLKDYFKEEKNYNKGSNFFEKENKLNELKNSCESCTLCSLYKTRNKLVFGKGNINADILFIGEAPGKNEDLQGKPFVGRAGENLNKMLNKIGLNLEDIYIANILKCRPPQNRDPIPEEIEKCTPYLIKQIEIIKPKIIITLGNYSTKFVLSNFKVSEMNKIPGVSRIHGNIFDKEINGNKVKVVPIYHPAAVLYRPQLWDEFEKDFNIVKSILDNKNE